MNNAEINRQLKSILSDTVNSYRRACNDSRSAYMATLKAGARIPEENRLYSAEERERFSSLCLESKHKVHDIFDSIKQEFKQKTTAAPSADAVNTISLLKARGDNLTPEEVHALLDQYGDNVQAFRAIKSIANEHKVYVYRDHPIDEKAKDIEGLEQSINNVLSPYSAESGRYSDGFLAFMNMSIDSCFPDDAAGA